MHMTLILTTLFSLISFVIIFFKHFCFMCISDKEKKSSILMFFILLYSPVIGQCLLLATLNKYYNLNMDQYFNE